MKLDDDAQDMLDRLAMKITVVVSIILVVTLVAECVIVLHFVAKYW